LRVESIIDVTTMYTDNHTPCHKYVLQLRILIKQLFDVSIVSGYGLDDRAIEVRSPAGAKGVFL
jgi:hypothetical protein